MGIARQLQGVDAGFRKIAANGTDLPVLNVFRMFAKLGATRIAARSDGEVTLDDMLKDGVRGKADVGVLAARGADGRIGMLVWHYHDDVAGPGAAVTLNLNGLGARTRVTQWRVDVANANAFSAWKAMGSPQSPDEKQYVRLGAASSMQAVALPPLAVRNGAGSVHFDLPRQGVTLLVIE